MSSNGTMDSISILEHKQALSAYIEEWSSQLHHILAERQNSYDELFNDVVPDDPAPSRGVHARIAQVTDLRPPDIFAHGEAATFRTWLHHTEFPDRPDREAVIMCDDPQEAEMDLSTCPRNGSIRIPVHPSRAVGNDDFHPSPRKKNEGKALGSPASRQTTSSASSVFAAHTSRDSSNDFEQLVFKLLGEESRCVGMLKWLTDQRNQCKEEPATTTRFQNLVNGKFVELFSALVICLNAFLIAHSSNYAIKHLDDPTSDFIEVAEKTFTGIYVTELVCRIAANKIRFFFCKDWKWNLFDTFLVAGAVYDQINILLTNKSGVSGNFIFLRIARLMKMLKLLRVVRIMRTYKELRLIISAVTGCLKSMLWAVLLIFVITFVVGVFFLQATTTFIMDNGVDSSVFEDLLAHWGSVQQAMLSLYMASTSGDSWRTIAQPLSHIGVPFYLLFLFYIAFFIFVVTNTLTSLFLEATIANAEKDQEMVVHEELKKKGQFIRKLQQFFNTMDNDGSGVISEAEFNMEDPELIAFASSLDIDVMDMAQFFSLLSNNGQDPVDIETFVVGCIKLRGPAKSLDLQFLLYLCKRLATDVHELCVACQEIRATTKLAVGLQGARSGSDLQETLVATTGQYLQIR